MSPYRRRSFDPPVPDKARETLIAVGGRIRELRKARNMTLQALAEASGLSSSMLSLVERGLAAPSIGSLVLVRDALGTEMSEFFARDGSNESVVVRSDEMPAVMTESEVALRVLRRDASAGICISISEYAPGLRSLPKSDAAPGTVHGLVLEGTLQMEIDGRSYSVGPGDLITYRTGQLRLMANESAKPARTLWFKIDAR